MRELLTIGGLAERAGVTTHTLRHYDDVGLVPATTRVSGRRRYDADAERRLELVRLCQRAGFTLAEIGELLDDEVDLTTTAATKRAELEDRIAELRQAQQLLDAAIACGCSSLIGCDRGSSLNSRPGHSSAASERPAAP